MRTLLAALGVLLWAMPAHAFLEIRTFQCSFSNGVVWQSVGDSTLKEVLITIDTKPLNNSQRQDLLTPVFVAIQDEQPPTFAQDNTGGWLTPESAGFGNYITLGQQSNQAGTYQLNLDRQELRIVNPKRAVWVAFACSSGGSPNVPVKAVVRIGPDGTISRN